MITPHIYLNGVDEDRMRRAIADTGRTADELAQSLVSEGLLAAYRDRPVRAYVCPVCRSSDPNAYLRCSRADCTDGRDPR